MLIPKNNSLPINKKNSFMDGDTIVEVLIAIAVAAFAIGTSYAIANKSLQRAISARDRNEALNIAENQIADLKLRYKNTHKDKFDTYFTVPSSTGVSGPFPHFCLIDSASNPDDNATWLPKNNNITSESQANNLSSTNYNASCIRNNGSSDYYVDITAMVTGASDSSSNRTVYKISVRWPEVGGGPIGQSVIYYRF